MNRIFKLSLFATFSLLFLVAILASEEPTMQIFLNEYHSSSEKNQKKYTKLLFAMEKNYPSIALKLLDNGEDPNFLAPNNSTMTPFMFAVFHGDDKVVRKMIQEGADVNLKSWIENHHVLPLQLDVIYNNDTKITKQICDSGAKFIINSRVSWEHNGWTFSDNDAFNLHDNPLTTAMRNSDFQKFKIIANTLSDQELNLLDGNHRNIFCTHIIWFSHNEGRENSFNIASYLLERGVLIETENGSALSSAASMGNIELMKLFIDWGADLNLKPLGDDCCLHNPIFAALKYCKEWPVLRNNSSRYKNYFPAKLDPLTLLLENKAILNFTFPPPQRKDRSIEFYGFSPLGYALLNNLNEAVELLIAFGADVNMSEGSGKTPLIRAIEAKNLTGVILLLKAGADPTKTGSGSKYTPIDIAYYQGNTEILKALIEAEANMY